MSVILNALRSEKKGGGANKTVAPSEEGLYFGKQGFVRKQPTSSPKRIVWLAAGLVIIITFSLTLRFFNSRKVNTLPPPQAEREKETSIKKIPNPLPPTPSLEGRGQGEGDLEEARTLFQQGDIDASLKAFQKALEQDPQNFSVHNDLGFLFLKKELYSSAEEHFKKALELKNDCAECFNNLGYLKTLLGQSVEAQKYLEKAIGLKSDYPDPYFNLGVLLEKNGDIGNAVSAYQKFLQIPSTAGSEPAIGLKQHLRELTGQ